MLLTIFVDGSYYPVDIPFCPSSEMNEFIAFLKERVEEIRKRENDLKALLKELSERLQADKHTKLPEWPEWPVRVGAWESRNGLYHIRTVARLFWKTFDFFILLVSVISAFEKVFTTPKQPKSHEIEETEEEK